MAGNEIWDSFLSGDKSALSDIFLNYHDDLFRYGMRLARNNEMVKDAIQDLFLKLWKNRKTIRSVGHIKPYLLKSLRNHIIDNLELQKPVTFQETDSESVLDISYSLEDFIPNNQVEEETRVKVIEALNNLTPRQREIIYLRYFEELDFATIAQVMGMNIQSVRNTIHRGMQTLRNLMLLQPFLILLSIQGKVF
jgi:RNA polymerase sigma factor (sigma-70 family)